MKKGLKIGIGLLVFGGMFTWALWYALWPPIGPIESTSRGPGLPSACAILAPGLAQELVPAPGFSHRTLNRRLSECTLDGAGHRLTLKISEHLGQDEAKRGYRQEEDTRKLFNRRFLPPAEHPRLGDQAMLDFSFDNTSVKATLMARKGSRVIEVHYSVPQVIPFGRGTDPALYDTARSGAQRAAAELLK